MSAWQPDNPVQFADGSLGCGPHHLVSCGRCYVDYTYTQENGYQDPDYSSSFGPPSSVYQNTSGDPSPIEHITRFSPRRNTDTPETLFTTGSRFQRRSKPGQFLIFTDGACPSNGRPSATAGCAFVFGYPSSGPSMTNTVSFPLERQGPSGFTYRPTSNRAELRAVIAALQFRSWVDEGWDELVIATDSEYVVMGATAWMRSWLRNGWRTNSGPVKNWDLWELLLHKLQTLPLRVLFWRIPREWNGWADEGAKAAAWQDAPTEFCTLYG